MTSSSRARSRQPFEVALVADEGVAARRIFTEIDPHNFGDRVAKWTRRHGDAPAERTQARLKLTVAAARGSFCVRQHPRQPDGIGHAAEGRVHGDEGSSGAIAQARRRKAFF
jgi:hypothetical protein